jgi:ElaB/YqjD/DUF883 family membrane-anchored ribosome-binding protein
MSEYEDLPELYDDGETVLSETETIPIEKPKRETKRKFTAKQLETVRKNLQKARETRQKQVKTRKKQEEEYENYVVEPEEPRRRKQSSRQQPQYYDDESGSDSGSDDYEPPPRRKGTGSKKRTKEEDRLARIEGILGDFIKAHKKAAKKKAPVHQTIVQVPRGNPKPVLPALPKLLKLF